MLTGPKKAIKAVFPGSKIQSQIRSVLEGLSELARDLKKIYGALTLMTVLEREKRWNRKIKD